MKDSLFYMEEMEPLELNGDFENGLAFGLGIAAGLIGGAIIAT